MEETELTQVPEERLTTTVFMGKDRHRRATGRRSNSSAAYTAMPECTNMSSEEYPCAVVRGGRLEQYDFFGGGRCDRLPGKLTDALILGDGSYAWLAGNATVMCRNKRWSATLDAAGRLLAFGNGLFVPDAVADGAPQGMFIPSRGEDGMALVRNVMACECTVSLTDGSGSGVTPTAQASAPASPTEGDYWYDTDDRGLYRYLDGKWTAVAAYHTRIVTADPEGLAAMALFKAGDTVRVGYAGETTAVQIEKVSTETGNEYMLLNTLLTPGADVDVTVCRIMPALDHAVVHDNRVWGCRYGLNADGDFVNEIYACRLGDPTNWFDARGMTADSWIASCGEPGAWTGAAVVGDNVVLFKEHCMYTVYGDTPDSYTTVLTYCDGVKSGSERSAALIDGALYYHSPRGIMRLTAGSLPVLVSDDVSYKNPWKKVIAGTDGRKYYALATVAADETTKWLVLDTQTGLWHEEDTRTEFVLSGETDTADAVCMARYGSELAAFVSTAEEIIDQDAVKVVWISSPAFEHIMAGRLYLCRQTEATATHPDGLIYPDSAADYPDGYEYSTGHAKGREQRVEWSFETGDFGTEEPDYKRVKSIVVRAWIDANAEYDIEIQYDEDGRWTPVVRQMTIRNGQTGSSRVDYRLRRCDVYRLRFSGRGRVCIYGITHTYEGDGDRAYAANQV